MPSLQPLEQNAVMPAVADKCVLLRNGNNSAGIGHTKNFSHCFA
jgi:hypothetical protein